MTEHGRIFIVDKEIMLIRGILKCVLVDEQATTEAIEVG